MVNITGLTGPGTSSDGGTPTLRTDKTSALVVSEGRGRYAEIASRGLLFSAAIPPGTGQAPGTAIGTTACFTLANPAASGINLILLDITVGYISGTIGAGTLALLAHTSAGASITAPSGGTAITPTCMKFGSSLTSGANCRFNNTVPASGLMIRAICSLFANTAATTVAPLAVRDEVAGEVCIGQGQAVSVQGIAAGGSSPLITVAMTWAEEPIVGAN